MGSVSNVERESDTGMEGVEGGEFVGGHNEGDLDDSNEIMFLI